MIVLISACSSSGKTLMAQTLLEKYKMPYYSIDHIKMGLFRSDENCGFHPCDDDEIIAHKLWPMLKGIIMTAIENNQNLVMEGCYILPKFINEFEASYRRQIVPIFFGFSEAYLREHFHKDIKRYRNIVETRETPDDRPIEVFLECHNKLKCDCKTHGVKYHEIQVNYQEETMLIYDYIDEFMKLGKS